MRTLHTALLVALAAATPALMPATIARAADGQARGTVSIQAGTGRVMHLRAAAANIFTADPKVAEVRTASPDSLFVWGVAPGTTTIAALNAQGEAVAQFQVTVVPSAYGSHQVNSDLRGERGYQPLRARDTAQGLALTGTVPNPRDAERAVNAAKGQLPQDGHVDNEMQVAQPIQVSLHVRIAEMNRVLTRQLGVNWTADARLGQHGVFGVTTNNNTVSTQSFTPSEAVLGLTHNMKLDVLLQALSDDQLIHLLAEPNLTTMSGEPASFLVGGEFPIPVATNTNQISIDFKQYGVSLTFVPTVLSNGAINLHVRPEVSQLDKANGVTLFFGNGTSGNPESIQVPGLQVRRADTTVELGSGQSFAIAGLLEDQTTVDGNAVPGMGDIPILGALFRSDSFQRQQDELVIVVTPYIVRPVSDPNALHAPTDGWRPPSDIERILYLRQGAVGSPGMKGGRRIPADAGFMVE